MVAVALSNEVGVGALLESSKPGLESRAVFKLLGANLELSTMGLATVLNPSSTRAASPRALPRIDNKFSSSPSLTQAMGLVASSLSAC